MADHGIDGVYVCQKCTGGNEGIHVDNAVFVPVVGAPEKDPSAVKKYRCGKDEFRHIQNVFKALLHPGKVTGIVSNGDPHNIHGTKDGYKNTCVILFSCFYRPFFL